MLGASLRRTCGCNCSSMSSAMGARMFGGASAPAVSTDDRGVSDLWGATRRLRPSCTPQNVKTSAELRELSGARSRRSPRRPGPRHQCPRPMSRGSSRRRLRGPVPVAPPVGRRVRSRGSTFQGTPRPEGRPNRADVGSGSERDHPNAVCPSRTAGGRRRLRKRPTDAQITLQRVTAMVSPSTMGVRAQEGLFQAISVPVGRYSLTGFVELRSHACRRLLAARLPRPHRPDCCGGSR